MKIQQVQANTTFTVGELSITTELTTYNLRWDSRTGIVSGTATSAVDSERFPIYVAGKTIGAIPVGGCSVALNGATLNYHYWYY